MDIQEPVYRDVSFRSLIVDPEALQSRVGIDKEWEKGIYDFLVQCIADGLPPTIKAPVVFEDPVTGDLYLADGFHRVGALMKLRPKLRSYKMQIIEGTKRDAIFYSVSANLAKGPLSPTPEDRRKSAYMLLSDPEWFDLSDNVIARKVGVSTATASKIRSEFCARHSVEMPTVVQVTLSDGVTYEKPRLRRKFFKPEIVERHEGRRVRFYMKVPGEKPLWLAGNREQAEQRFSELMSAREAPDSPAVARASLTAPLFQAWLGRRGVGMTTQTKTRLKSTLLSFAPDLFDRSGALKLIDSPSQIALSHAFGELFLFRSTPGQFERLVIVCYPPDDCAEIAELIRHHGVEVMTPEEFVASVKPQQEGERSA